MYDSSERLFVEFIVTHQVHLDGSEDHVKASLLFSPNLRRVGRSVGMLLRRGHSCAFELDDVLPQSQMHFCVGGTLGDFYVEAFPLGGRVALSCFLN